MRIIEPSIEIMGNPDPKAMLRMMEAAGRVCYKSENYTKEDSAGPFLQRLIASGHESVIEHEKLTVRVICDRGVTHELVRHRIASYSQESTRYCNYTRNKFGSELMFIRPPFWQEEDPNFQLWKAEMESIEETYQKMIANGARPEEARSVLPNSLKTEIVVTMNIREWRHFLRLRGAHAAHPQIRQISKQIHEAFLQLLPELFSDIEVEGVE